MTSCCFYCTRWKPAAHHFLQCPPPSFHFSLKLLMKVVVGSYLPPRRAVGQPPSCTWTWRRCSIRTPCPRIYPPAGPADGILNKKINKLRFNAVLWIRIRMLLDLLDPDRSLFVRIRIRIWVRILPSSSKNNKKNLDFSCFVTFFYLWRMI